MRIRVSAIIERDNKVLLIYRIKDEKEYFVFPGGGIEDGESSTDAIKREIKEEIGINIENVKVAFEFEEKDPRRDNLQKHIYYAIDDFEGKPKWNSSGPEIHSEQNSYKLVWINKEKLKSMENVYPEKAKQLLVEKQ